MSVVLQIHSEEKGDGDILVFLTGREEIETMGSLLQHCRPLFPASWKEMIVCPLFAALPTKQQQKAFSKTPKVHYSSCAPSQYVTPHVLFSQGCRKVILSTNVAETSITIPGVCYVVDTGMVKARGYNPHIGLDLLCVQPVSKAQVCVCVCVCVRGRKERVRALCCCMRVLFLRPGRGLAGQGGRALDTATDCSQKNRLKVLGSVNTAFKHTACCLKALTFDSPARCYGARDPAVPSGLSGPPAAGLGDH